MDSDDDDFFDAEDDFDDVGSCEQPPTSQDGAPLSHPEQASASGASGLGASAGPGAADTGSVRGMESRELYPLQRAAWYGQTELVKRLASGMTKEQLKAYDSQGNTALHVAVMRRQAAVVSELLAADCSLRRNARGWVPLMEAVELGDRGVALQLAAAEMAQVRAAVKSKKAALLALLRSELPDFSLQLKWELGSSMPGVGALVRRYAPHDTYTLWKKGGLIRVDGSLMGIDTDSSSVVPAWKRGHFSLLYDATGEKARSVLVNHTEKTYLDVKSVRKKGVAAEAESNELEMEVDLMLAAEVLQRKKLRSVDFRFKPVSGWLTKEVREKVEGWNCKLYEASGRLIAVTYYKMPYGLTPDMSFDDYLAASFEPDPVVESPVNPLNPASLQGRGSDPTKAAAKLTVAAKHQRIAAVAAAAKDEPAARIAKAAAARAAAGGLRALAPRVCGSGASEEEEGGDGKREEAGADGREEDGGSSDKQRGGWALGKRGTRVRKVPSATAWKGGRRRDESGKSGNVAHVVAAAAATTPYREHRTGDEAAVEEDGDEEEEGEEEEGGEGEGGVQDLAELDLSALAARVAAEAAVAQQAKSVQGKDDAAADGDDADADADADCGGGGVSRDDEGTSFEAGTASGRDADLEATSRTGIGKRADAATAAAAAAGPSSAAAATALGGSSKKADGGNGSGSGRPTHGSSGKGWRSWGFGRKAVESSCSKGDGEGGSGGGGGGGGGGPAGSAAAPAAAAGTSSVAKKSRKFTGRCWMAESFPLSLKQLLPLLEVVGTANKAFVKVAHFMQKYGDLEMFPVKVQVPLILTVFMLLSFKQFRLLGERQGCEAAPPDDFFQIPPGYTEDKLLKAQSGTPSRTCEDTPEELKDGASDGTKGPAAAEAAEPGSISGSAAAAISAAPAAAAAASGCSGAGGCGNGGSSGDGDGGAGAAGARKGGVRLRGSGRRSRSRGCSGGGLSMSVWLQG